MPLIRDVVVGTFDDSVGRELMKRFNSMTNSISSAYLIALRARKVSAGEFTKLLVSLHKSEPPRAHEEALNVYIYNVQFNFEAFERASFQERCNIILQTLHAGLLEICQVLRLECDDFVSAYEEVKASNFVYKYRKGNAVVNKKSGLTATLGTINTPAWTAIVAYVQALEDGHEVDTLTFVKSEMPDLRFEARYLGRVKWLSSSHLALIPKDSTLTPIEVDVPLVH
jgi:hypothetical protein